MAVDRLTQINEVLRVELARELSMVMELPPHVLVSVTKVRTAPDLRTAAVYLSITPIERSGTVLTIARKQLGRVVQGVSARVPMRRFPKLRLIIDEGAIRAAHIETLLDSIK